MQQTPRKALGRGLESLIGPQILPMEASEANKPTPTVAPIEKIFANRQQPRLGFKDESLQELALSIKREGVLQPLIVTPSADGRYELVAGERRLRASRMAGLKEVPVIVKTVSDEKMLELALVENIQREDLNSIDEAKGYYAMIEKLNLSHADVAESVGKSREHVANSLRLLKLPKLIQDDVAYGKISAGHARALLSLNNLEEQLQLRETILAETLSVRDVEKMIQEKGGMRKKNHRSQKKNLSGQIKLLLDELEKSLGTRVRLQMSAVDGKGALQIEYYSWQDFDRIYKKIIA
ncbi:MAG: ParB/RepB/Spo0J family partition protein [Deltaproteobacteria bacterium]|nr:ParB/RepB/Spo0J family partition protein [Deltaproteobacteria bacterium]